MSLAVGTNRVLRLSKVSPARAWRLVVTTIGRMRRDAALRRELQRMDDHMLSDLGVSRAQLMFDADRRM